MCDVVGDQVVAVCLPILNGAASVRQLNGTTVVLIPKIKNPVKMGGFRPISLCNALYKFVRKTLANRLEVFLDTIISQVQSAFVLGRLISDDIIVVYEVMHSLMKKKKMKKKGG